MRHINKYPCPAQKQWYLLAFVTAIFIVSYILSPPDNYFLCLKDFSTIFLSLYSLLRLIGEPGHILFDLVEEPGWISEEGCKCAKMKLKISVKSTQVNHLLLTFRHIAFSDNDKELKLLEKHLAVCVDLKERNRDKLIMDFPSTQTVYIVFDEEAYRRDFEFNLECEVKIQLSDRTFFHALSIPITIRSQC